MQQTRQYSFTPLEAAMFEQNILIKQMHKNPGVYSSAEIKKAQNDYDDMMKTHEEYQKKLKKGGSKKSKSKCRRGRKLRRRTRKH